MISSAVASLPMATMSTIIRAIATPPVSITM
jgi:hypothetical protein